MKKNYFTLCKFFLFATLLITACSKSAMETGESVTTENTALKQMNQCQLTFAVDWGGLPNWYHYNEKGLADEWRVDFGSGIPDVITMVYDNNNHLSTAEWHYDGSLIGTMEFVWTGNFITVEHWDIIGVIQFDMINTYNARGQMTKRATSNGYHTTYEYTPEGNHLRDVIYFGVEPLQSDEYTYNQPNKNPSLAVQGMPYMFLYINPIHTKWFPTSDKFTIYENGEPVVVLDIDPSKTVMQMTHQNYLSSVTYFDNVSGEYLEKNFEYQNCGPGSNSAARANNVPPGKVFSRGKTFSNRGQIWSPEQLRRQVAEMKKQALEKK